jgi:hypothetical protein
MINPKIYGAPIVSGKMVDSFEIVYVNNLKPISTLVLNSFSGKISLSVDGNLFYDGVTPTQEQSGQLYYVLTFPVRAIQFQGNPGDTYAII